MTKRLAVCCCFPLLWVCLKVDSSIAPSLKGADQQFRTTASHRMSCVAEKTGFIGLCETLPPFSNSIAQCTAFGLRQYTYGKIRMEPTWLCDTRHGYESGIR